MTDIQLSPILSQLTTRESCYVCGYNKSFGFYSKKGWFYCRNCYRKLSKKYTIQLVTSFTTFDRPATLSPIDTAICDIIQTLLNNVFPIPLELAKRIRTLIKEQYGIGLPTNYPYLTLLQQLITDYGWTIPTIDERRKMNELFVQLWIETHHPQEINQLVQMYAEIQGCSIESARKAVKIWVVQIDPYGIYHREMLVEKQKTVQLMLL